MTNPSRAAATEAMAKIDEYYPLFLMNAGIADTPIVKAGYYAAVLESVKKDPLPNEKTQSIFESKLSEALYKAKAAAVGNGQPKKGQGARQRAQKK